MVEQKTKLDGKLNEEDLEKKEDVSVLLLTSSNDDGDGSNSVVVSNINVLDLGRGRQNQRMVSGSLSPETQSESPALLRTEDTWVGWLRWCRLPAGTSTQSCASCLNTSVPVVPECNTKL